MQRGNYVCRRPADGLMYVARGRVWAGGTQRGGSGPLIPAINQSVPGPHG